MSCSPDEFAKSWVAATSHDRCGRRDLPCYGKFEQFELLHFFADEILCQDGAPARRPVLEEQIFTALRKDCGPDGYTSRSFLYMFVFVLLIRLRRALGRPMPLRWQKPTC